MPSLTCPAARWMEEASCYSLPCEFAVLLCAELMLSMLLPPPLLPQSPPGSARCWVTHARLIYHSLLTLSHSPVASGISAVIRVSTSLCAHLRDSEPSGSADLLCLWGKHPPCIRRSVFQHVLPSRPGAFAVSCASRIGYSPVAWGYEKSSCRKLP